MSKSVVNEFVSGYVREFDFYREAARLCSDRCERFLAARGIKAILSHRAKRPNKLLTKLVQRDATKDYQDFSAIRSDIPDLAGVRIALYFPGDRDRIKATLNDMFYVADQRTFPRDGIRRPGKRFDGYCADHYRVQLFESSLDDSTKHYATALIEIQVGSVLMHGWSEVEHDLIYKPESGELSEDEHAILDELNGMVIAGEIALERLQRAVERRLGQTSVKFESHYDLAVFLNKWLRNTALTSEPLMGRIDVLWELLKRSGLSDASSLGEFLGHGFEVTSDEPLADQLSDALLKSRPGLYRDYVDIQTKLSYQGIWDENSEFIHKRASEFGAFLSAWIILERTFSFLIDYKKQGKSRPGMFYKDMTATAERLELSGTSLTTIWESRILRNHLVHGVDIPGPTALRQATFDLNSVLSELSAHPNQDVRAAYEKARKPLQD